MSLRDIMELGAKAYENGDLDGLVSSYAGNAVLESPEGRYEGLDAIREYWATNLSGISQASVELTTSVESGDVYFGEFRLRGTNTGDITLPDGTEIPATGKSLEISAVEMCRVSGDKIVEHKMWWDNLGAFAQLGLLPG